ncbi:MAG: hypothetical protein AAB410_05010 [Patescibacteria group bacterium]
MYDEIINSRTLSQATAVFLNFPPRSFPINEAGGILRVSIGRAAHILNRLTALGLMRGFSKHGKKFFYLNTQHELPAWARNKILKGRKKAEDKLSADLKKLGVKAVFLSGVFTGYSTLPVDLLLVGRVDLKKLDSFLVKWQSIMGVELNYSLMSENEYLSRRDTFDKFIKDIFDHRVVAVVDRLGKK